MRAAQRQLRALGDDAVGVDMAVAGVVMALDVDEVDGFGDSGPLVQFAQPVGQVRIVLDPPQIAFEVPVIDGVEANDCSEQAPVRLGQVFAGEVASLAEALLQPVEFAE